MAFTEGDIVDYAECIEVTFFALSLFEPRPFLNHNSSKITIILRERHLFWESLEDNPSPVVIR